MTALPEPTSRPRRARRARRRTTVSGVLGEILITAGVLVLLFLGWKVWFNDIVFGASQHAVAEDLSEQFEQDFSAGDTEHEVVPGNPGEPVVMLPVAEKTTFANLIIPRLGDDYKRPIAEGVGNSVLNDAKLGTGHYPQTQMPGEIGNFGLVAHRSAYGGAFHNINELVVGDAIYVETQDGWYKYIFRSLEFVHPTGVGVLAPVPQQVGVPATQRVITLTTCNPLLSTAERMVAYGVFDSWYPRADGPPAELALVTAASEAR